MTKVFVAAVLAGSCLLLSCAGARRTTTDRELVLLRDELPYAELVERAEHAELAARGAWDDPYAQRAAALALFEFIDMKLTVAALRRVESVQPTTGEELLALEHALEEPLVAWIEDVGSRGLRHAARARLLAPGDAGAHHVYALHAGLRLRALPPLAAVARLRGVMAAMEATLAIDPTWNAGAPLLLYGRLLDRAPWPHQNRTRAIALLERAVALQPSALALLFLGDARFGMGDRFELAIETWERAVAVAQSEHSVVAPLVARRARERLLRERHWLE